LVALDTNILVYAQGINGAARQALATALLDRLLDDEVVIPVQALGELFNVLVRKGGFHPAAARAAVAAWREGYTVPATSFGLLEAAMELVAQHRLAIWDAIILAAAAEAGCDTLFSEDMQHGFVWRGVTVCDPFRAG
jgi:predicted nucleic acid-binding protein